MQKGKQKKLYYCFKGNVTPESKEFIRNLDKYCNKKHFEIETKIDNKTFGVNISLKPNTFKAKKKIPKRNGNGLELQDKMPNELKKLLRVK